MIIYLLTLKWLTLMKEANIKMFKFNPNLGGGVIYLPPCWLSPNNSEMVKALTLVFCSIQ